MRFKVIARLSPSEYTVFHTVGLNRAYTKLKSLNCKDYSIIDLKGA